MKRILKLKTENFAVADEDGSVITSYKNNVQIVDVEEIVKNNYDINGAQVYFVGEGPLPTIGINGSIIIVEPKGTLLQYFFPVGLENVYASCVSFNSDQTKLAKLNMVMQPLIRDEIWRQVKNYQKQQIPYVILDAPLLFEENYADECDLVVVVATDHQIQVQRLMKRNGYSQAEAEQRIDSQMPLAEKKRLADIVIDNNGSKEELKRQVAGLIDQMHNNRL